MTDIADQALAPHPDTSAVSVDGTGTSYLIVSYGWGENSEVARGWLTEALALGPAQWLTFDAFDAGAGRQLGRALRSSLNGLRTMIVGPQFDVLQTVALARSSGALELEIQSVITDRADLPIYCAHCRATSRVHGAPGGTVACPGCARTLEIHPHLSGTRGSYLASDALARDLP